MPSYVRARAIWRPCRSHSYGRWLRSGTPHGGRPTVKTPQPPRWKEQQRLRRSVRYSPSCSIAPMDALEPCRSEPRAFAPWCSICPNVKRPSHHPPRPSSPLGERGSPEKIWSQVCPAPGAGASEWQARGVPRVAELRCRSGCHSGPGFTFLFVGSRSAVMSQTIADHDVCALLMGRRLGVHRR